MPTYAYTCPNGHRHERMRVEPDDFYPRECPECKRPAERQMGTPFAHVKGGTPKFHHVGRE